MSRLSLLKNFQATHKLISSRYFCRKSTAPRVKSSIVWIDMEMTGLDVQNDRILEVACAITDNDLNILAKHPTIVIHQSDAVFDAMGEWCKTTHAQTGLLEECRKSTITEAQAEKSLLEFFKKNRIAPLGSPLAGNSIWTDRMFLHFHMPQIDQYLNYRLIDVSSVKELCKRWNPSLFSKIPAKKSLHRGENDINESIEEAKFYKRALFPKIV